MSARFIFKPIALATMVISIYSMPVTTFAAETGVTTNTASTISTANTVSESYVRLMARNIYFRVWPMANIYNRRVIFSHIPHPALQGGIVPVAPLNQLSMLTDYIDPMERLVACPNQDVVYGAAVLALDKEPVVVQVPDFGDRFWVYQAVDVRTNSFAELGKQYATKPGFYLLVGPDWHGKIPDGITRVFRSPTNTGMVIPRIFQSDLPEDKNAVRTVISQIAAYPLSEYTGKMKTQDWRHLPVIQSPANESHQQGENQWVNPETFFDELPLLLADAKPQPGEEVMYKQMAYLAALAKNNPQMRNIMIDEAKKTEKEMISPLMQFSNMGVKLPYHWATINNGAEFGTDYYTRTAVAKSNILVNKNIETKYYYLDVSQDGKKLNGDKKYTLTIPNGKLPVKGFWSLTLYNVHHFFVPNELKRYSVGTKTPGLKYNKDGSLTLYIQSKAPTPDLAQNWLPSPENEDFALYIRAYWPDQDILSGKWTPPAVIAE